MTTTIPRVQYVQERPPSSDPAVCTVVVNRLIESRMLLVANSGAGVLVDIGRDMQAAPTLFPKGLPR